MGLGALPSGPPGQDPPPQEAAGARRLSRRTRPRRPWSAFRRLAVAQAAHTGGDAMVAVALADTLFFSVPLGEARGQVALYLALTMAPFALLSPLVGPLLDRHSGSYRLAIFGSALGRVVATLLLADRTNGLGLFPLAFTILVFSRVHGVSRSALVPDALPPGRTLIWANGRLAVLSSLSGAVAAGVGVGLSQAFEGGAVLYAAAAMFIIGVMVSIDLPRGSAEGAQRPTSGADFRDLLSVHLLAGGVAMATARLSVGFATFFLAFVLRATGEDARALVVVVGAAAGGALAGAVLAPPMRRVVPEMVLLVGVLAIVSAAAAWAATDYGLGRAAVLAGTIGLASGAGRLAFDSLLQTDAPQAVRGRTFARYETIFQLCWVVGAGIALVPFEPAAGLWVLSLLCLLGAALAMRGLRASRPPARRRILHRAVAPRRRPG